MQVRNWLDNLVEAFGDEVALSLRVVLKSGNELDIEWTASFDTYGTADELTNGDYMIDTRSVAAIEYVKSAD